MFNKEAIVRMVPGGGLIGLEPIKTAKQPVGAATGCC